MADVATADAPVTTPPESAPVAPAATPPSPQVETTPESGPATPGDGATAAQTPPEPAVPSLTELLKDPKFKAQYDGATGERIRRERMAAQQEALAARAQEEAQRFAYNEQQIVAQETALRQREAWELGQLQAGGDPFDISTKLAAITKRQQEWDANWNATQSQRQALTQIQQQIQKAAADAETRANKEMDTYFLTLPRPVQEEMQGKWHPDRASALVEWHAAHERFLEGKHQSDVDVRAEAKFKKMLAQANLNAEDFDTGSGTPTANGSYRYAEDWEKAFANDEIDERQALRLRAQNLPRRSNR